MRYQKAIVSAAISVLFGVGLLLPQLASAGLPGVQHNVQKANYNIRGANGRFSTSGKPKRVRHDRQAAKVARHLLRMHKKNPTIKTLTEKGVTAELFNSTHPFPFLPSMTPKRTNKPELSIYTTSSNGFNRHFDVQNVRLGNNSYHGHPFKLLGGRVIQTYSSRDSIGAVRTVATPKAKLRSVPNPDKRTWKNNGYQIEIPAVRSAQPRDKESGRFGKKVPVTDYKMWDALVQ